MRALQRAAVCLMASLIILTGQINSWNQPLGRDTSKINRTDVRLRGESPVRTDQIEQARVSEAYGKLPLSLEANLGQTDSRVKFLSRGPGFTLFLTQSEAVFSTQSSTVLRMKLARANRSESIEGVEQLPGKSNYFIGNDRRKWRANVPSYSKVRYKNVYSGIDLVYYGNQQELEYDFIVSPGAATPWFSINNGLTSTNVNALVIDPTDSSTVYVGTGIGVFKTIDGGQNWRSVNRGLIGMTIISLALDPDDPAVVHAGGGASGLSSFRRMVKARGPSALKSGRTSQPALAWDQLHLSRADRHDPPGGDGWRRLSRHNLSPQ